MRIDFWFAVALLLALNFVAFAAQGLDKFLARHGARRISEHRLLWLGAPLAAGGMWLGMRTFRHKTSKSSFLGYAWLVTAVNAALAFALYWLWERDWLEFRL